MGTTGDGYLMTRGAAPSNRLISQHYLWKGELGWNLHPAAKGKWSTNEPRQVADVATGNGIWIFEEARHLPVGSKAYGFDISAAQFPSADTVPENVVLQILDIRGPIPPELQNAFDIVHVRLIVAAVYENDPRPILKNLMSMLKPGGMLQWSEIAPRVVVLGERDNRPPPSAATNIMAAFMQRLSGTHIPDEKRWIFRLAEIFEESRLEGVMSVKAGEPRRETWKYWCDNCYAALEEVVRGSGIGAEYLSEFAKEREQDQYWWCEPRIVIGWNPELSQ